MGFVDEAEIRWVAVHDGEIGIKENLSIGAVLGMAQGKPLAALTVKTPETVTAMLNGGIVAWRGEKYDGVPVTPENIARLELTVAAVVLNEIDELFTGPEKKGLSSSKSSNGASGRKTSSGSKSPTA